MLGSLFHQFFVSGGAIALWLTVSIGFGTVVGWFCKPDGGRAVLLTYLLAAILIVVQVLATNSALAANPLHLCESFLLSTTPAALAALFVGSRTPPHDL